MGSIDVFNHEGCCPDNEQAHHNVRGTLFRFIPRNMVAATHYVADAGHY